MKQKIPPAVTAVVVLALIASAIIVLTITKNPSPALPAQYGPSEPAGPALPGTPQITMIETPAALPSLPANISPDNAGITNEEAKVLAGKAFPNLKPGQVIMKFSDGPDARRGWNFELMKDDELLVSGRLDPNTGELMEYSVPVGWRGRQEFPGIAMDSAQGIAKDEIRNRHGEISLKLVESRYDPFLMVPRGEDVTGIYVFIYKRIIRSVPCDSDGIRVNVDSANGKIVEYSKMWDLPENAVAAQSDPVISRDAAIALVEKEAKARYPQSSDSLKIISADLLWKDLHNPNMITPAPESIPLGWKIVFDDETIRAQQYPSPGTGWVDAEDGTLLDLYYRH